MKFLIIGLGNFGSSLAEKLTQLGHEVIGVDKQLGKVDDIKDKITYAICLDCKHQNAINSLPIKNTDVVIVCIGEDEGASLLITALLKKMDVPRLISRSVSPIQETILEAMGITEILRPEEEAASRWAKRLTSKGIVDSLEISDKYSIVHAEVPNRFVGKTVGEVGFNSDYSILVLTIISKIQESTFMGLIKTNTKMHIEGVASANTVLNQGDIMVIFGHNDNIYKLLKY
jgi:trk system potassium uptake protein TrkA